MAVGLRVRNQGTGQIQIGTGYRNLQLAKSGTLDTGSFQGRSTSGSPPFASSSPYGLLASTAGTTNLHVVRYINNSVAFITGFSIVQSGLSCYVFAANNAPNKTLEYYTFDATERATSGPVGLRMRGEDGSVFYDSRRKGLRVLQVVPLPPPPVNTPFVEVGQFFPGTKIGIAIPSPRFYYASVSQDRCTAYADAFHMTGDNRIFMSKHETFSQTLITNTFPVGGVTMGPQNATIFIVDLTEVPLGFG
ncbi:TPA: hypothetical protein UOK25_000864 [Stenotrophomonas maltophilia]|nr:hypothetical protein [Stenotrophomonas maltophilia]